MNSDVLAQIMVTKRVKTINTCPLIKRIGTPLNFYDGPVSSISASINFNGIYLKDPPIFYRSTRIKHVRWTDKIYRCIDKNTGAPIKVRWTDKFYLFTVKVIGPRINF